MLRTHVLTALGSGMNSAFRLAVFLWLLPVGLVAEFLPEALGEFERKSLEKFYPGDRDIFDEFGFEAGEKAHYETAAGLALDLSATRYLDATGAFAAFQWMRPVEGTPAPYGEEAFQRGDVTLIRFGNYVVRMQGATPVDDHVEVMLGFLPRVQTSPPPPLLKYVPADQRVVNSERYILGPAALEALEPTIPPSVAAFHFGTEAQFVRYRSPAGELKLLLFSYPSSQIARGQIGPFNELPDAVAKRTGPLIAVVPSPVSADEAQHLLARVRYAAEVTVSPRERRRHDDLGTLILDILILCVLLASLMIVGGVIVAGSRLLARRYAPNSLFASREGADMIRLDLDRRG